MKFKRFILPVVVTTVALAACAVLMFGLASTHSVAAVDVLPPVTFPDGPWPWYAQEEISLNPEPPMLGQPVEICVEVVSHDMSNVNIVTLLFGVTEFGISDMFMPVGEVNVEVPPGLPAHGCMGWVPPEPGPWAVEVILEQEGYDPQRSLRVVDLWEPLVPGEPHELEFVVGPLRKPANIR